MARVRFVEAGITTLSPQSAHVPCARMSELHVGLFVDAGEVVDPLIDKVFSRFSAGAPARNRTWICGFGDRKPP